MIDGPPPAGATPPAEGALPGLGGDWQRLHPLSPLVRAGRGVIALFVVVVIPLLASRNPQSGNSLVHLGILLVVLVLAVVSWLVTRWRVDEGVLLVEAGLIRRTSERFPLSQIQAIDTVRPGLARIFGLAELRIRLASGTGKAGRLAYLTSDEADALRARLLALAHGLAAETPAPPERPLVSVPTGQLVASILLSGPGLLLEVVIAGLVLLATLAPGAAAATISGGAAPLLGVLFGVFRRFNAEYRLQVAEAPDGLRLRSGLIETSAETIPAGRIQAIRMIEPLAWRPFGWCRLEVDVAGQKNRGRQDRNQAKAARALLPVGSHDQAAFLLGRLFPDQPTDRLRPPARTRWKSPLRFRFLSWAVNDSYALTTSGRIRRVTDWVPLAKVQSVRSVEGPVQRRLRLSSIHLDTAGRRVHAVIRDRDRAETTRLMDDLPVRCRRARAVEAAHRARQLHDAGRPAAVSGQRGPE
ncbi:MAG TPA: PH domain-containing protein [Solirubrobacteraceae bacterium]|nr:PH domain-containing protein [Solirubrobacteraceae bacterium]